MSRNSLTTKPTPFILLNMMTKTMLRQSILQRFEESLFIEENADGTWTVTSDCVRDHHGEPMVATVEAPLARSFQASGNTEMTHGAILKETGFGMYQGRHKTWYADERYIADTVFAVWLAEAASWEVRLRDEVRAFDVVQELSA